MQIHESFASEMAPSHYIQAHFCPNTAIYEKWCGRLQQCESFQGNGAGGGTRTPTLLAPEPKSGASTSSATPALLLGLARSGVCIAPGQAQSKVKKSRVNQVRNFTGKRFRALIFSKLICARMNIKNTV